MTRLLVAAFWAGAIWVTVTAAAWIGAATTITEWWRTLR